MTLLVGPQQRQVLNAKVQGLKVAAAALAVSSAKTKSRVIVTRAQSLFSDQLLSLQRRLCASGSSDTGRLQALSVQSELQSITTVKIRRAQPEQGWQQQTSSFTRICHSLRPNPAHEHLEQHATRACDAPASPPPPRPPTCAAASAPRYGVSGLGPGCQALQPGGKGGTLGTARLIERKLEWLR